VTPRIDQFLDRTVLVSIPALFSDGACRPYRLMGFELHGLWLQSDDLNQRLLTDATNEFAATAPVVFVPFAQIAGVMVPTALHAELPPGADRASVPDVTLPAEDRPAARRPRRHAGQRRTGQAVEEGRRRRPKTE